MFSKAGASASWHQMVAVASAPCNCFSALCLVSGLYLDTWQAKSSNSLTVQFASSWPFDSVLSSSGLHPPANNHMAHARVACIAIGTCECYLSENSCVASRSSSDRMIRLAIAMRKPEDAN